MKLSLSIGALIAALISAALWFWSAKMRINYSAMGTFNGPAPSVLKQLHQQARLNRWAALATGLSVLLQALAGLAPS